MTDDKGQTQPMLEALFARLVEFEANVIGRFEQVDNRIEQVNSRFEQVDNRFEQINSRFEQVDNRFNDLEQKVDSLAKDLEIGLSRVHDELSVISDDIRNSRAKQKDLNRRIEELESKAS